MPIGDDVREALRLAAGMTFEEFEAEFKRSDVMRNAIIFQIMRGAYRQRVEQDLSGRSRYTHVYDFTERDEQAGTAPLQVPAGFEHADGSIEASAQPARRRKDDNA